MGNPEKAKSEGYKRGIEGKINSGGITQGWTDDEKEKDARSAGYEEGNRDRMRIEAEKKGKQ